MSELRIPDPSFFKDRFDILGVTDFTENPKLYAQVLAEVESQFELQRDHFTEI